VSNPFDIPDLDAPHGFAVETHGAVTSTQDVLRERLAAGEEVVGTVVRASLQTTGRGRRGNTWSSESGGSYQSVALPALDGTIPLALVPLALSVGVAAALTAAGARTSVKWPNDLVLGDRKLGGLIVEVTRGVPLAGIGVNVENEVPTGRAALRGWDTDTVGDLVLLGVRRALAVLERGADAVIAGFSAVDWLRGKTVRFAGGDGRGVAQGIDAQGCLLLADEVGAVTVHCSGHVEKVAGVDWR